MAQVPTDDIEELLPWYATGRLTPEEHARVQAALERDPELALRHDLVRRELAEAAAATEALGSPSTRAKDRLFEQIAADGTRSASARSFLGRAFGRLASGSTGEAARPLRLAFAFAALLIILQAVTIGVMLVRLGPSLFTTATGSGDGDSSTGTFALIGFAPDATAAQITGVMESSQARVVDGPRAGGFYRVRLSNSKLSKEDEDRALGDLRGKTGIVIFAEPSR
ncbi:MAG: hypothetical protein JO273_00370 [Methylobacteriaceae bacterium]|nr:hypothetical protein [Methylobacteriaceae bacterium]